MTPRTAQAAMRHSSIDLTTNTYTDPKLLDVYGALDSLPALNIDALPSSERPAMRATGTDDQGGTSSAFAPNAGKPGQSVSFAVIASGNADDLAAQQRRDENPSKPSEKALSAGVANKAFSVEATGRQLNCGGAACGAGVAT